MTLQGRTLRGLYAGAIAGLIAWLWIDRSGAFNDILRNPDGFVPSRHTDILQACLGGVYGMLVAGLLMAGRQDARSFWGVSQMRRIAFAALIGYAAGAVGISIGQACYNLAYPPSQDAQPGPTHAQLLAGIVARCIGWAVTGMFIGASQGVLRRSVRAACNGLVGGIIGGLAGGSVFEAFDVVAANPSLARLGGFIFLGAAIGFFTEAMPVLMRRAWLVIDGPKVRAAQWLIDSPSLSIGHSSGADLRLMNDPAVAAIHCHLLARSGCLTLLPAQVKTYRPETNGAGESVAVAVQPVTVDGELLEAAVDLYGGEQIGIGEHVLRLHVRGRRAVPASVLAVSEARRKQRQTLEKTTHVSPLHTAASVNDPLTEAEVGAVASKRKLAGEGISGTRLVGIQGPYFDQTFLLGSLTVVEIGRDPECDIALVNDASISRTHARVTLDTGRHFLTDTDSANGTFYNGSRLEGGVSIMLVPGDVIRIGDTILRYE